MNKLIVMLLVPLCGADNLARASADAELIRALTSGPEYLAAPPSSIRKLSDYLPLFVNKPLEFEPGTSQRYSNAGYIVLGLIIERLSGQTYYDYVRQHVTFFDDANPSNRATPITK